MYLLPAEWYEQDGVVLTWPHQDTDMAPFLKQVYPIYLKISQAITQRQKLVLIVHDSILKSKVENQLISYKVDLKNVIFIIAPTNDIWIRDYGIITLINSQKKLKINNFIFNGWGNKYTSYLDNRINSYLIDQVINPEVKTESIPFVLEGGAIDSNGKGTLLTTKSCLFNTNRNPQFTQRQTKKILTEKLGAKKIICLEHGYLEGDDTDSHVDTLVRFAPKNTIVYVTCHDKKDSHYKDIQGLEAELKDLKTEEAKNYNLISLPWPEPKYNAQGNRLPATYANYLIINGAVLVPIYRDRSDEIALIQIQKAYPNYHIIGIDCLPLIYQFGSLHCISMQLPKGLLK
ncbi:Agmatine deiminase [cyanobacterium endosymbiont of Rhopalodia gibberula]|uniref:agmatine deiminase family protein n=1 Tax=cyanobacterium endosymbiont of Rhopalodia gibberula TaxID=1763363 RepID=UPI000DC72149|nr:agmatine deiminase family protein [cyanobacterium endosymbiont of Rhopalodia gibberula]BBA79316.1 Agmatine deiminase [cyanobacterium endosymbiont of Rhopalodia gibberula]